MRLERLDIDMQFWRIGRQFIPGIYLPSIRLSGQLLGYKCLEPVSAIQDDLQYACVPDQSPNDGIVLSPRHLEPDAGCT